MYNEQDHLNYFLRTHLTVLEESLGSVEWQNSGLKTITKGSYFG